ncbi:hypothetical protein K461DRAFT_267775 [Myriangium duriaei CBS 260.36]|uniref:Copper-fist domain-containing protein n=1 Tax=Myriangium duriaei CBS 260.36 TaxID=1168546 RepID=A0A9P4MMW5_9PEZI|nr:hypothetical protein K461DRAFT_267775 [Myriangium duriaei CBS 260.36]
MVIKEDGSKWACQSCLKGHRVSGCTHTDRPLQFVPKKGRPVTQCQHCRVERKKRSAHVKCDCGEKPHSKEKCIHLRNAEAAQAEPGSQLVPVLEHEEPADQNCCCSHGEKCVCFMSKKVPENELHQPHPRPKPRLTTTQSEGHLTVFANGHHKPVHRNNHAAHDANMPYRVHKPHPTHAVHGLHAAGRRSVDSLVSTDKVVKLSMEQIQQLAAEATTPGNVTDAQTPATEVTYSAFAIPADSMAPSGTDDFFSMPDNAFQPTETSMNGYPHSAISEASGDFNWNTFDWTFGGVENTQPALTYASSNTISEFGDHTPPDENGLGFNLSANTNAVNDVSTQGSGANPPVSFAPFNRPSETQQNRWSLPPSFWADPSNNPFANMAAGFDSRVTDEKTNSSGGNNDPFSNFDANVTTTSAPSQENSMITNNISLFNAPVFVTRDGKSQDSAPCAWDQGAASSSMQFNEQYTPVNAGPDLMNFGGYMSDHESSNSTYRQDQPDTFFGLDSTDPIDFSQDFTTNDIRETWSS